jgi:integrase
MAKRARGMHRLSPREVNTLPDGMRADGGGLYLQVTGNGRGRSWIFRYHVEGRGDRNMGLGPTHTVGLAEAREKARLARLARLEGDDPLELREKARLERKLEAAKEVTFEACVEGWMASRTWSPHWAGVTRSMLRRFAYPGLGKLPIQQLDMERSGSAVSLVQKVLEPLWLTKTPTAKYLQQSIEGVLNWAIAKQYISGGNAASLKGPLGQLLQPLKQILVHEHYEALPYKEVGAFMAQLRSFEDLKKIRKDFIQGEVGAATLRQRRYKERHHPRITNNTSAAEKAALEFLVLTAVRKGQVLKMRWEDVDRVERIWVCEHHKTKKKTGNDYVVPLSDQAMAVLDAMQELQEASGIESEYVFLGRFKKPIGHNTLNDLLARMPGRENITPHGFRTAFGDWSVEHGHDERDSEMALGHVVGNGVRNIYKRNAKRIEPRRLMMQAWADYCHRTEPLPAEVIPIRRAKSEENAA